TSWLVNTDNYCTEQLVSAGMPRLVAAKWSALPVFTRALSPAMGNGRAADALAAQIEAIQSRQNAAGGFGVWTATPNSEPFISAYAMHFLIEARERGIAVPRETMEQGDNYLRQLAGNEGLNSLEELRQRAYAVYLLTREGNVTTNYIAGTQKRLME